MGTRKNHTDASTNAIDPDTGEINFAGGTESGERSERGGNYFQTESGAILDGRAESYELGRSREEPDRQVAAPFFRTEYNYDRNVASDNSGLSCPEPTKTQQNFKDEVDINTIVERFGLTGELPTDVRMPQSGDFTDVTDFQGAMNLIRQAEEGFMEMPANIRARFHNNPAEFLDFVHDEKNVDEAIKLGVLLKKPEIKAPDPVLVRLAKEEEPKAP